MSREGIREAEWGIISKKVLEGLDCHRVCNLRMLLAKEGPQTPAFLLTNGRIC